MSKNGDAKLAYEAAIRLGPQDAEAHLSLGVILEKTGRCEEAVAEYREAIRIQPDDAADARENLALLLRDFPRLRRGQSDEENRSWFSGLTNAIFGSSSPE